jgi:hypothetical protein
MGALFQNHEAKVGRLMEIRGAGTARIPGKIMRLRRFVTAFVTVGADGNAGTQCKMGRKETNEVLRDPIKEFPAIFRTDSPDLEQRPVIAGM